MWQYVCIKRSQYTIDISNYRQLITLTSKISSWTCLYHFWQNSLVILILFWLYPCFIKNIKLPMSFKNNLTTEKKIEQSIALIKNNITDQG